MVTPFKRAALLLLSALSCLALVFPAFAADARVYDMAGLFGTQQAADLEERIELLRGSIGMDVAVATTDNAEGRTARQYADELYENYGFGTGGDYSGVLLLIDMDNREAYISTEGRMIDLLTDQRIERILDDAFDGLASGDYYAAAVSFLNGVERYAQAGVPQGQYRYDTDLGQVVRERHVNWGRVALFALISLAAGGLCCGAVVMRYRMRFSSNPYPLRQNSSLNLTGQEDIFINQTITRQKIQTNSSGGSHGGGGAGRSSVHRSSGGRTHGGGGRRF